MNINSKCENHINVIFNTMYNDEHVLNYDNKSDYIDNNISMDNTISMDILKDEIRVIEIELLKKKKMLIIKRLELISGIKLSKANVYISNIDCNNIDKTWCITYNYKTDNFSQLLYDYDHNIKNIDDPENIDCKELTDFNNELNNVNNIKYHTFTCENTIMFGKSNKYFIKKNKKFVDDVNLHVYKNKTTDELYIVNKDYEYELDLDEQKLLVTKYSKNYNIPEWFAITVFLYLDVNNWDDESFVNYLSII